MDVDLTEHLDLHIPGYEYLWNCAIYLKPTISGVVLSFQWTEFFHDSVFYDLDNSSWVKCYKCNHCFHSKCVSNLTNKDRDALLRLTGPFVCCA